METRQRPPSGQNNQRAYYTESGELLAVNLYWRTAQFHRICTYQRTCVNLAIVLLHGIPGMLVSAVNLVCTHNIMHVILYVLYLTININKTQT